MQVDPRIPFDDAHSTRDHRMRAGTGHERAPVSPGAPPVEPPHNGGPLATVRPEFDRLRDAVSSGQDKKHQERRRRAKKALAAHLGLPDDADIGLEVIGSGDDVRVVVRDLHTGALLGALGPELLAGLGDLGDCGPAGNLLDRSS